MLKNTYSCGQDRWERFAEIFWFVVDVSVAGHQFRVPQFYQRVLGIWPDDEYVLQVLGKIEAHRNGPVS